MPEELTREQLEQLKARDERVRVLDEALEIEQEVHRSKTLAIVRSYAKERADIALQQLALVNPGDWQRILELQRDVQVHHTIETIIKACLQRGAQAIAALEDERAPDFDLPSEE